MQRPLSVGAAGGVRSSLLFAIGRALLEPSPSNLESCLLPLLAPLWQKGSSISFTFLLWCWGYSWALLRAGPVLDLLWLLRFAQSRCMSTRPNLELEELRRQVFDLQVLLHALQDHVEVLETERRLEEFLVVRESSEPAATQSLLLTSRAQSLDSA